MTLFQKLYPKHKKNEVNNFITNGVKFIEDSQKLDGSWYVFIIKYGYIYVCNPSRGLTEWFSSKIILAGHPYLNFDEGKRIKKKNIALCPHLPFFKLYPKHRKNKVNNFIINVVKFIEDSQNLMAHDTILLWKFTCVFLPKSWSSDFQVNLF